jgi:RsiW-degrading membrane proteinase PrsW (M82 family)
LALALTVCAGALVCALAGRVQKGARTGEEPDEHAAVLSSTGWYAAAESAYVGLLRESPTVPRILAFIDNHERGLHATLKRRAGGGGDLPPGGHDEDLMPAEAVEGVLAGLPAELALIGRFVWEGDEAEPTPAVKALVEVGADRDPPSPWFNHVLAVDALRSGDAESAARRLEREGLSFPERAEDVDQALNLWMGAEDWDTARLRMADPQVRAAVGPDTKARFAEHERDWAGAAWWNAVGYRARLRPWSVAMSATAAIAWGLFCARLGKIGQRPGRKTAFYLTAFVLGVLSVVPTVIAIAVEEAKLRLVETGDAGRDMLYFVFGVGLREEACKLLLLSPLLPFVRRWGDRLDVLVCGAMTGLGFAAEENLNYLASGDLRVGLGRFLTANFFHMALTGTLAAAFSDFLSDTERNASDFSRVALTVIGLHGAYDFLLSHDEYGGGFLAMTVFFFVGRVFLDAIERARRTVDKGLSLVQVFVVATAVVTGVSAVRAGTTVGPAQAAAVMAEGLVGEAVTFLVLLRALEGM